MDILGNIEDGINISEKTGHGILVWTMGSISIKEHEMDIW